MRVRLEPPFPKSGGAVGLTATFDRGEPGHVSGSRLVPRRPEGVSGMQRSEENACHERKGAVDHGGNCFTLGRGLAEALADFDDADDGADEE